MFGTLVNTVTIIVGGFVGLMFKNKIEDKNAAGVRLAMGIAIIIIGLNGIITNTITVSDGILQSSGELLLLASLVIGTFIGERLRLDDYLKRLSNNIEKRFSVSGFSSAFVSGTLLYCVGAMSIVGPINDVLAGDSSILLVKSTLDGISSIIFGATLGAGVIFACIPVFFYQGTISLLAMCFGDFIPSEMLTQICMVGYAIIVCIGINFLCEKPIKTANMLPGLLVPVAYYFISLI